MNVPDYDIVVFGSGFGGSLMAIVARRLGLNVAIVERGSHPRFAIGESTSPLANLLLEQLAVDYDLPFLLPLTTYGAWQQAYHEIAVGLKRGFTYYAHKAGERFDPQKDRSTQLLVAASPSNDVSDTHWYRSDFDHFLVKQAIELGVDYRDRTEVTGLGRERKSWRISGTANGEPFQLRARVLIDATGPRGLLQRLLHIPEATYSSFPAQYALFSHFTNVLRCDQMDEYATPGDPPFAPDDAALHHIFDGGWMWVLRFNNGVTSAGISVDANLAAELDIDCDPAAAWRRFLERLPSIKSQFEGASPILPFVRTSRLSYRASMAASPGWAMLPSAAAFLDPLYSTGIPLTLLGIERLGSILKVSWDSDIDAALSDYGKLTLTEADATAELVGASLRSLGRFPQFAAFSMFYFAAASYSEMARRLDRRHLAEGYLAAQRSDFRERMRQCITAMEAHHTSNAEDFLTLVAFCIDALNIAGLADPAKRNWYPVDLQDVVRGAGKLHWTPQAMQKILATAEWAKS